MNIVRLLVVFAAIFGGFSLYAADFNAGFVEGLWLNSEPVFVGNTVRMYVAVRNNTGADLTGRVEFYDGEKLLERKNIAILDGRIAESWTDWEPLYGEHILTATLSRIELQKVGSSSVPVEVTSSLAKRKIFVDHDTDRDGIGNEDDTDDDADGVPDEEERANGTDPLDPDSPSSVSDEENGEGDPEAENNMGSDELSSSQSEVATSDSGEDKKGLEQFLTESRANEALTSVTHIINKTKLQLDDYRASRNSATIEERETAATESDPSAEEGRETATATKTSLPTTEETVDGFGEVSRIQGEKVGIAAKTFRLIKAGVNAIYTFLLFLFSHYLAHPIIVQLTLLFLILFLVYKITRRIGRRPS